ncbi:Protein FAR1-RELATED SEQUENCE [Arachis hypogaea]|nr:Protein FAR1-RELATED SEQUENCE [Arachis hypogaea]
MKLEKCHGFGIYQGDYGKNEAGNVIRRRFFCNRTWLRDEKHYNKLDWRRSHRPHYQKKKKFKMAVFMGITAVITAIMTKNGSSKKRWYSGRHSDYYGVFLL